MRTNLIVSGLFSGQVSEIKAEGVLGETARNVKSGILHRNTPPCSLPNDFWPVGAWGSDAVGWWLVSMGEGIGAAEAQVAPCP